MSKSVYTRRTELYRAWTGLYNIDTLNMTFEEFNKIREEEDAIFKHWQFYDKLLKRMEVMKYGNKKKKCNKKANCTYKGSKKATSIRERF